MNNKLNEQKQNVVSIIKNNYDKYQTELSKTINDELNYSYRLINKILKELVKDDVIKIVYKNYNFRNIYYEIV